MGKRRMNGKNGAAHILPQEDLKREADRYLGALLSVHQDMGEPYDALPEKVKGKFQEVMVNGYTILDSTKYQLPTDDVKAIIQEKVRDFLETPNDDKLQYLETLNKSWSAIGKEKLELIKSQREAGFLLAEDRPYVARGIKNDDRVVVR